MVAVPLPQRLPELFSLLRNSSPALVDSSGGPSLATTPTSATPLASLQYSGPDGLLWWPFPGHNAYQVLLRSPVFYFIIPDMAAILVNIIVYDRVRMLNSITGFELRFHVALDIASYIEFMKEVFNVQWVT